MNAELRELAAAGCPLIQVEEPPHHMRAQQPDAKYADLEFLTTHSNRQLTGVNAEIWVHTCWGNPNKDQAKARPLGMPSYERALPHLLQLNCYVLTARMRELDGKDLHLFKHIKTDRRSASGWSPLQHVVEPAEHVASLIRKGAGYIPKEQLVISTDCGFGREGLSRGASAFYMCVALVEGTNIVRRELGLPEARVRQPIRSCGSRDANRLSEFQCDHPGRRAQGDQRIDTAVDGQALAKGTFRGNEMPVRRDADLVDTRLAWRWP